MAVGSAGAQQVPASHPGATPLDSLVTQALEANPAILAAAARVDAARARISPAGTLPDPTLMAGLVNVPVAHPSFTADGMTMKMVGIAQNIPFPGKLAARRRTFQLEADVMAVARDTLRLALVRSVKSDYYELAYLDHALAIVRQNEQVLADLAGAAQSHYTVGTGGQQDVLRARVAATQLGETANTLIEQRRATLAALNAVLNRPSDTPVDDARFPERLTHAAVASDARDIRFVANTLGAPAADSPLPSLAQLQALASVQNPGLLVHDAMMSAQAARVEYAQEEYRPDFEVSVQYGQRVGLPDMLTAQVSIPLQLHRRAVQDEQVADERAGMAVLDAEHQSQLNDLQATVTRLYTQIERNRTQLALYVRAIIPQGRASLASTTASYQVGKADLTALLDSQTTLFSYETAYYRALADFGESVAQLEQLVGQEIIK